MELLEVFLALFFVGQTDAEAKSLKGWQRALLVVSIVVSCTLAYYLVRLSLMW